MQDSTLWTLAALAGGLGVMHTVLGPDHYVPFIAMARAGRWSVRRTLWITSLCGLGHVLGSIVLGASGIVLGTSVASLEGLEQYRGELAGWLLLGFGIAYTAWGIRRAIRNRPHSHVHAHSDGTVHVHRHIHHQDHVHVHSDRTPDLPGVRVVTPWVLFLIFVFGPCEPLIPLLMYPAAKLHLGGIVLAAAMFAAATLATMLAVVCVGVYGLMRLSSGSGWLTRYAHALAGTALTACGLAIKLGL